MITRWLAQTVVSLIPAAMRYLVAFAVFAISVTPLLAQSAPLLPDEMVEHFCHASQVMSGDEFDEVGGIIRRLGTANQHIHILVTNSHDINSLDVNLSTEASIICIPVGLVHFMGTEGELAFIMGHEIGHATDKRCKSLKGRLRIAPLATLLGRISGEGAGDQRACEIRADELGFKVMTRAGYDPNDAAAALQRLAERPGSSPEGPAVLARLEALGEDHPATAERIRHIRKLIAKAGSRREHSGTGEDRIHPAE